MVKLFSVRLNDTAENKAQQVKEEVEQGETVVKVTTQNR